MSKKEEKPQACPRSVVFAGEPGHGKSTAAKLLARRGGHVVVPLRDEAERICLAAGADNTRVWRSSPDEPLSSSKPWSANVLRHLRHGFGACASDDMVKRLLAEAAACQATLDPDDLMVWIDNNVSRTAAAELWANSAAVVAEDVRRGVPYLRLDREVALLHTTYPPRGIAVPDACSRFDLEAATAKFGALRVWVDAGQRPVSAAPKFRRRSDSYTDTSKHVDHILINDGSIALLERRIRAMVSQWRLHPVRSAEGMRDETGAH